MPDCKAPLPECLERLENIEDKLDTISKALLGNGTPDNSVVVKLARHDTYLKVLGAAILAIPAVVGVIFAAIKLAK